MELELLGEIVVQDPVVGLERRWISTARPEGTADQSMRQPAGDFSKPVIRGDGGMILADWTRTRLVVTRAGCKRGSSVNTGPSSGDAS